MPMRCEVCSQRDRDGNLTDRARMARVEWGCDEKQTYPILEVSCRRCAGTVGNTFCPRCEGRGREPIWRCPNTLISGDPGLSRFFECFDLMQQGVMPARGGLLDQTARFMEYVKIAQRARDDMRSDDGN